MASTPALGQFPCLAGGSDHDFAQLHLGPKVGLRLPREINSALSLIRAGRGIGNPEVIASLPCVELPALSDPFPGYRACGEEVLVTFPAYLLPDEELPRKEKVNRTFHLIGYLGREGIYNVLTRISQ